MTEDMTNLITEDMTKYLIQDDIIGIDLGTTNTCIGIWRNGNLEIIPDEYGNRTIPSYVGFTNINRYVGLDAKKQKDINTKNVFYEVKRLIGRKASDSIIMKEKELLSYQIGCDDSDNIILVSELNNKKTFTPEEISAAILSKAKTLASNYLGKPISKAVITIPAHFNDGQRQATKDAATIAGLECIRIINEPTAAAMAYGLMHRSNKPKTIMVYDFGGGTLDVSLMQIDNGIFEVMCVSGNSRIGGVDFDNRLMAYTIAKFQKQNKIEKINGLSAISLQKLRTGCEQAKKILSVSTKTNICVGEFYETDTKVFDLVVSVSRDDIEKICGDLFVSVLKPIEDILREEKITTNDIDEVILVGGMTRMPKIRELIRLKFNGREPNITINPDEAVAAGAAIQAHILSHKEEAFSDSITLLDSTALSLGIETVGGVMDCLIQRGSIIPVSEERLYTTDKDYTDSITVKIYEGERAMTKDNFFVGEFELKGIEPVPRGLPEILVSVNIDSNGIIVVSAEDKKTHEKNSLSVTSNKGRLSAEKINQLIEEAVDFEIRDELEKHKKMYHYQIDDYCNTIMINIKNKEFKLSEKDSQIITTDIKKITDWLYSCKWNQHDTDKLEKTLESIKHKYGVMILKANSDNVLDMTGTYNSVGTNIFEDEDDNKNSFEKISNSGLSDESVADIKELRKAITDLCYSVFDILTSNSLKISQQHMGEIKDYVDDTLLWMHISDTYTKQDYVSKIDEINNTCNKVFEHYGEKIFDEKSSKRDELENLCIVIGLLIEDGGFDNSSELEELKAKITEYLTFIYKSDESGILICVKEYEEKINKISMLFDYVKNIQPIDCIKTVQQNPIHIISIESKESSEMGTDIMTLIKDKQNIIIESMINEDN